MSDTVKLNSNRVRMIAHRGLSGLERENTNAAFVAAGNRGYYGIETDIHRTLDGKFIIYHDNNMSRLAELDWIVEEHTLEELRSLTLKDTDGHKRSDLVLPTLEEYIRICKKYGKYSILELKNRFEIADIQRVIEILRDENWLDHTVMISFVLENLIAVRDFLPDQPLQYLVYRIDPEVPEILDQYALDLDVKYVDLTLEQVRMIHASGHKVNVWTVNNANDGISMAELGVDFITTNILE